MPKRNVTVQLPNLAPAVSVPPHLERPLIELIIAGGQGITSQELKDTGCLHPSRAVPSLKKIGAFIESALCEDIDDRGRLRRVVRYTYWGWSPASPSVVSTTDQLEDPRWK